MKQLFVITFVAGSMFLTACGNNKEQQKEQGATATTIATDSATEKTYDVALVDNKKDPTCGMPTTAGISDTTHYKNKVLGFCSTECKAEFLKNPTANIAAAELK